jgi:hypothetical protein
MTITATVINAISHSSAMMSKIRISLSGMVKLQRKTPAQNPAQSDHYDETNASSAGVAPSHEL